MDNRMLRPDAKGRISLGERAKGVSGFMISEDKQHRIILTPYSEFPAYETWLHANKEAKKKVDQGLADVAAKRVRSRGSFKKYAKDETD